MKWRRGAGAGQVVDLRGSGGRGVRPVAVGGGLVGVVVALIAAFLGMGNLGDGGGGFDIPGLTGFETAQPGTATSVVPTDVCAAGQSDDERACFVQAVTGDVQDEWTRIFQTSGRSYEPTQVVLFRDGVQTGGCGSATSATGPFYCPADRFVYLDLGFFDELAQRFGAPGDFAQAYVVAHEFGHHVQNVLGVNAQVTEMQQRQPDDANELSVRLELQADCFSGVWAHSVFAEGNLESGDIESAVTAAQAVGDDRLQRGAGQIPNPETWTHGSSDQRRQWFERGYQSGDPDQCDTFG